LTSQLQAAIEDVYRAFGDIRRPAKVDGCPCCIDKNNVPILLSKPLRALSPDDLSHYAGSVFLTVGDLDDFLYFLPRILEILATDSGWWPDPEVVSRALHTAGFHSWPSHRREAVSKYFDAVTTELLEKEGAGYEIDSWICAFGRLHVDLTPFLRRIAAEKSRLKEFYAVNSSDLQNQKLSNGFWDDAPQEHKIVVDWFQSREIRSAINSAYGLD